MRQPIHVDVFGRMRYAPTDEPELLTINYHYGKQQEKHLGDYYPDIDYDSDRYRDDLGRDLLYLSNCQLFRVCS